MFFYVMSIMLRYVMLCSVLLYVMLCSVVLCYVMFCCVILWSIELCHILYLIILRYFANSFQSSLYVTQAMSAVLKIKNAGRTEGYPLSY